jgi:hypothetical protein
MMNVFKKIMFLCLFLIVFSLVGCNLANTGEQLPESKPKDFNFVFNYAVNAKNQLNTIKGQYTKDMITEPSVTTDLILSDEEMNSIYLDMRKINILNYPENFNPKGNLGQKPFQTYSIKIVANGKEKYIYWKDENISQTKNANQLRELFKKIQERIIKKEEYKKLPPAKGGYV